MYLCFVDESGSHGASPVLVVGGIIIHEEDVWHLQRRLDTFLFRRLHALGHDHTDFELHGSEIRRGGKQWDKVDQPGPRNTRDEHYMRHLWQQFDAEDGHMHGLIHDCSYHRRCRCPACASRR